MEGQWKQRSGKAVYHLGKAKNDELAAMTDKYKEPVGRVQGRYRIAKKEAKREVEQYASYAST
jgi:uncharacterized protein YjbJ (UPF0337 family)